MSRNIRRSNTLGPLVARESDASRPIAWGMRPRNVNLLIMLRGNKETTIRCIDTRDPLADCAIHLGDVLGVRGLAQIAKISGFLGV